MDNQNFQLPLIFAVSALHASEPLFDLGKVCITGGMYMSVLEASYPHMAVKELSACVKKHISGDWGLICREDAEQNNSSILSGGRLMSEYKPDFLNEKIWIITEFDRSATTILFPSEY